MRNLLNLFSWSKDEIVRILDVAVQMRRIILSPNKKSPQLLGQTLVCLTEKSCFETTALSLASQYLSGNAEILNCSDNWMEDARAAEAMGANFLAIKNDNDAFIDSFSHDSKCCIVNAGSKLYNPLKVLAYLLVLRTKLDGLNNLSVAVVGCGKTNVVAELDYCLTLFNSSLVWYLPKDDISTVRKGIVVDSLQNAVSGADAILDLGLSQFSQGDRYYGTNFGLEKETIDKARVAAPLLSSRVAVEKRGLSQYVFNTVDTEYSCYLAVCMAVLYSYTKI